MTPLVAAAAIVCGYLLGSLPTGVLVARARGVDIRKLGSGNIGATNVARTLGKKTGAVVLVVDVLKGLAPTLAARLLWRDAPLGPEVIAAIGLAAVVGHVFPVWLKLRGGKGVATGFGVFLALSPLASAVAFGLYAAVYLAKRISSLGSLTAATSVPIVLALEGAPRPFLALGVLAWVLIVIRHAGNIRRLLRQEESRL